MRLCRSLASHDRRIVSVLDVYYVHQIPYQPRSLGPSLSNVSNIKVGGFIEERLVSQSLDQSVLQLSFSFVGDDLAKTG